MCEQRRTWTCGKVGTCLECNWAKVRQTLSSPCESVLCLPKLLATFHSSLTELVDSSLWIQPFLFYFYVSFFFLCCSVWCFSWPLSLKTSCFLNLPNSCIETGRKRTETFSFSTSTLLSRYGLDQLFSWNWGKQETFCRFCIFSNQSQWWSAKPPPNLICRNGVKENNQFVGLVFNVLPSFQSLLQSQDVSRVCVTLKSFWWRNQPY